MTETPKPNSAGTTNVPGPTGALSAIANDTKNTPVAIVTTPKGTPVTVEMPSSNTKRGLLPKRVSATSR